MPDQDQNKQDYHEIFWRIVVQCTNSNLRRTSRAVAQLYDEFLQPSGLLATQFMLLGAIAGNGPIALTPLAEMLMLDPTTLARNLKPLQREGLVEISPGEDRRTRMLRITVQGKEALAKAFPLWEEAQKWVIAQLGEDHWRAMLGDWSELVSLVRRR